MIGADIRHLLILVALLLGAACTAQPAPPVTPSSTIAVPTLAPTTTNTPAVATPSPTLAPSPAPTPALPAPTPVKTPDLAALDATIAQMEASVRAGDGNRYL